MATRSPVEAHNYWGVYATPATLAAVIGDPRLQSGDFAFVASTAQPYVFDGVAWRQNPTAFVPPSAAGQVLTWNGTEWVPALGGGGSGGGGVIYYLDEVNAGDPPITGLDPATKTLDTTAQVATTTVTSGALGAGWTFVAGFVTDPGVPGTTDIPAGVWDFNLWADTSSVVPNDVSFRASIYAYNGVAPTLIATSVSVGVSNPGAQTQYITSVLVPATVIAVTDRVYVVLEATTNVPGDTITFSFGGLTPSHIHTTLPSVGGTGIVHVVNGVIQTPASPVNFAGGATEITGTLPIGNGGTGLATTPTNGQLLIGNGAGYTQATLTAGSGVTITNGAGSIAIAAAGGIGQYPAIDANTILAWNFAAAAGPFANLGTAGVGGDMVTIGAGVGRNVPGPINPGVQLTNAANNTVYTAQGPAANIGSASFTNQMTAMVVFELNVLPAHGGYQRLLWKGYVNAGWTAPFGSGVVMEFFNSNLDVNFFSAAGLRGNSNPSIAATTLYWNTRYHLLVATYDGTISRMYWDGEMVRLANFGSASNLQMGAPGNEGPWTLGGRYNLSANESINGKIYYARVDNVVRNDAWVRRAWADLNGWP